MPTRILVEIPLDRGEQGGHQASARTAQTSDLMWVQNKFVGSSSSMPLELNSIRNGETSVNDTTLSGSLLLEALQQFESARIDPSAEKMPEPAARTPGSLHSEHRRPALSREGSALKRMSLSSPFLHSDHASYDTERTSPKETQEKIDVLKPRGIERRLGPMERLYNEKYRKIVKERIERHRSMNPDALPAYQKMNESEREKAQVRVIALLKRLNLHHEVEVGIHERPDQSAMMDTSCCSPQTQISPLSRATNADYSQTMTPCNPTTEESKSKLVGVSFNLNSSQHSDASSVELARSRVMFESPIVTPNLARKRTATTSGKRGADTSRAKLYDAEIDMFEGMQEQPSEILEASSHNLSLAIGAGLTQESPTPVADDASDDRSLHAPFGDSTHSDDASIDADDPPCSPSTLQNTTVRPFGNVPVNVCLKEGETLFYRPLDAKCGNRREQSRRFSHAFPKAFEGYSERARKKLERLLIWLRARECRNGRALVLSTAVQQTIDLVLEMVHQQDSDPERVPKSSLERAGTLIVVRSKDELEEWSRAFRERSPLSVLNHPDLPRSSRKSKSNVVSALASHPIVLSTFDELKAADGAVSCDEKGVARASSSQRGGWVESQAVGEARNCKHTSFLHHMHWRRVFFLDVLGKKCFIIKHGTARAAAAASLRAETRIAFVTGTNDGDPSLHDLLKFHRTASQSLGSILQLDDEVSDDFATSGVFADFNDPSVWLRSRNR